MTDRLVTTKKREMSVTNVNRKENVAAAAACG